MSEHASTSRGAEGESQANSLLRIEPEAGLNITTLRSPPKQNLSRIT